jgi:hypothetical protein
MPPSNVSGTVPASGADMPVLPNKPRKRKRLVNLSANRGPNQGAPPSDTLNQYPFPFAGLFHTTRSLASAPRAASALGGRPPLARWVATTSAAATSASTADA